MTLFVQYNVPSWLCIYVLVLLNHVSRLYFHLLPVEFGDFVSLSSRNITMFLIFKKHALVEKNSRAAVKIALSAAFLANSPYCSSPSVKMKGCLFWTASLHNEGLQFCIPKGYIFNTKQQPFIVKRDAVLGIGCSPSNMKGLRSMPETANLFTT